MDSSSTVLNLNQFSALTGILYQTTLDHAKWSEFVSKLAHVTNVPQSYMIAVGGASKVPFAPVTPNLDPDFVLNYGQHYRHHDLWISAMPKLSMGRVWETDSVLGRRKVERSTFYNEWLLPQEDIHRGLALIVAKNSARSVVLGANVRRIDHDRVEEGWMEAVKTLGPHIRQAFSMATVVGQDKLNSLARSTVQTNEDISAILIVGMQANLIFANEVAYGLLDDGKLVATGMGGAIRFAEVDCALQFQSALAGLTASATNVSRICLGVDAKFGPYEVRMARLDPFDPPIPFTFSIDEPALLITIGCLSQNNGITAILHSKFALTLAEAAVVDMFLAGMSLRSISDDKQVSIHTVRNQMKAAMLKLGVRSQIELMTFLQRL